MEPGFQPFEMRPARGFETFDQVLPKVVRTTTSVRAIELADHPAVDIQESRLAGRCTPYRRTTRAAASLRQRGASGTPRAGFGGRTASRHGRLPLARSADPLPP